MALPQTVLPQVDQRGVRLRAEGTAVRSLSGVRPGVRFEAAGVGEALRTVLTLEGQLPGVNAKVAGEAGLLREGLRTDGAPVGPVAAVGEQVIRQVAPLGEGQ